MRKKGVNRYVLIGLGLALLIATPSYSQDNQYNIKSAKPPKPSADCSNSPMQIYDAAFDFLPGWTAATNPNGCWTYGWIEDLSGVLHIYSSGASINASRACIVVCVKFSKLVVVAGVGSFQVNSDIPLFDRQDHPFAPTWPLAERRAQRQSRMPQAPAEPARSVLDRASVVLS